VTPDDARKTLLAAAKMRMPRFDERDTAGMRIEKLEEYMLQIAITTGDLEEARLHIQMALRALQIRWADLQGWEIHLQGKATKPRTKTEIIEAKRLTDPVLHDGIEESKFLIARLTEQIHRLSRMGDDQIASRVYTLLAGT
jgi:hypothetical protein